MFAYLFKRFMWHIGYRLVLYSPGSRSYLAMADFWKWEFGPMTDKRDYTERDWPL